MIILAAAVPAVASTPDAAPGRAVTFAESLALGEAGARVLGARAAAQVRAAVRDGRTGWTNPLLTIQPGLRTAPVDQRGPEVTGSLLLGRNLAGLGAAREEGARAEELQLDAEAVAAALEQRLGAARAWIDLYAAQALVETAQRELALAEQLSSLTAKARGLAAATEADVAVARAFLAERRLALLDAEGERAERALSLAQEIEKPDATPACAGDLPAPALPAVADPLALVAALPGPRAASLRARAARARAVEERALRGTHLGFGAAALRDGAGAVVVSGVVQLTLPAFDRGGREAGWREAEAARAQGDAERARISAAVALRRALHDVEHAGEVAEVVEGEFAPSAEEAARLTQRLFAGGEATMTDVLQARRSAVLAEARLQRARATLAWARINAFLLLQAATAPRATGLNPAALPASPEKP